MVLLPPIDEQKLICQAVHTSVLQLDMMANATETAIDRLSEYRSALITAATTGKVDVRNVKTPQLAV
jgi:type I restriction enzyme S subunit